MEGVLRNNHNIDFVLPEGASIVLANPHVEEGGWIYLPGQPFGEFYRHPDSINVINFF